MSTYAISVNRKWLYKHIHENDLETIMNMIAHHCTECHASAKIYNNESHACIANFSANDNQWAIKHNCKFYKRTYYDRLKNNNAV